MAVHLLGPVEVVVEGEAVALGAGRPAQILVALTLAPGRRLTVDELSIRRGAVDQQRSQHRR